MVLLIACDLRTHILHRLAASWRAVEHCLPVAAPGAPVVEELCTTVVWQEPAELNGVITGYQLLFSTDRDPVPREASVRFLVTNQAHQADGVTVQVSQL